MRSIPKLNKFVPIGVTTLCIAFAATSNSTMVRPLLAQDEDPTPVGDPSCSVVFVSVDARETGAKEALAAAEAAFDAKIAKGKAQIEAAGCEVVSCKIVGSGDGTGPARPTISLGLVPGSTTVYYAVYSANVEFCWVCEEPGNDDDDETPEPDPGPGPRPSNDF